MGFQSSFGNVGIMAVFATGGVLYTAFGWEAPFLLWTAVCLGTVGTTYLAARSSTLVGRPARVPDPNHSAAPKKQLAIILFLGAVTGAGYALLFNFGNLFAVYRGYDLVRSDWLVASWMAAATLGALSFARFSGVWGRGRILAVGYGVVATTMVAIVYGGSSFAFIAAFLINGFALSLTYPGIYAWLSDHTQGAARGAAFGLLFALQITGQAVFSFASGWLADIFTLEAPYLLMALLAFFALVTLPVVRQPPARAVAMPAPAPA
jgi:MFS family permease